MFTEIYKNAIKKEVLKVYDLAWDKLVEEQKKLVKILEKIFEKWYNLALQELKYNEKIKINDFLEVLNSDVVKKFSDEDDLEKISKKLEAWFNIWASNLDKSFLKNPKINFSFWLSDENAIKYAKEKWSKLITWIDDYTKERIAWVVTKAIEDWKWYNIIAKELKKDYAFSSYRANLIASHELWNAYLHWKDEQFKKYREKFWVDGFKQWVSHRDNKTSEGCLSNDHEWWIPYSQDFSSWHSWPTRFPWCRCNIVYNILNPDEIRLDDDNATESDLIQAKIPKDTWFDPWIKPVDYDKYSTNIIWASFFNEIWEASIYTNEWKIAYYNSLMNTINLPDSKQIFKETAEVHELWHFFFEKKVLKDNKLLEKVEKIFNNSLEEFKEKIKVKEFLEILTYEKTVEEIVYKEKDLIEYYELIKYSEGFDFNKKFLIDVNSFYDLVQNFSDENYWYWHEPWYFKNDYIKIQEYFAQLNQVNFLDNQILKVLLPKTYENMKNFYKNNWFKF